MTPIYAPGQKRWHCLMVPPQGERRAKAWLAARGVYGFYPVEERTRVRLGRQSTHERPYIPGYVFAQFRGEPIWHAILGEQSDDAQRFRPVVRVFTGVIRSGDQPAWLHPSVRSPPSEWLVWLWKLPSATVKGSPSGARSAAARTTRADFICAIGTTAGRSTRPTTTRVDASLG